MRNFIISYGSKKWVVTELKLNVFEIISSGFVLSRNNKTFTFSGTKRQIKAKFYRIIKLGEN